VTHDLEIAGKTDKTFRLDDGKLVIEDGKKKRK
jgi:ABC-type lipoprotein export system ATPase subunit